jgi:predicted nucleotidyltransferase
MANEMINNGLSPGILESIKELCQRYRVRELSIFGSALREDFRTDSDVDLLVEFEPEAQIGFVTLSRMQRELSAILNRPVDLVPKGGLKAKIRESVISNAKVIYAP